MPETPVGKKLLLIPALLILLALVVNCFGPMRLTNDTVTYFSMMEKMSGTWPARFVPEERIFPVGYPCFLFLLNHLGILSSSTVVLFQIAYLLGSLYFLIRIFDNRINPWFFSFIFLSSWLTIKFTLFPLSEMQYLFASTGALYAYQRFEEKRTAWSAVFTVLFCLLAIYTRTVGTALIPALVAAFFLKNRKEFTNWRMKDKVITALTILFLAVVLTYILVTSPYTESLWEQFRSDPLLFSVNSFVGHLTDWGEIFINLPMSKAASYTSAGLSKAVYMTAGCVSLALVLHALFVRRLLKLAHIEIYLVLYMIGVFNSPSFDSRFWMPILPFLLFIVLKSKVPSYILTPYKALYIASGLFALGYYSFLSFNKEAFAARHDAGIWKKEYEILFSGKTDEQSRIDTPALYLLNKYN